MLRRGDTDCQSMLRRGDTDCQSMLRRGDTDCQSMLQRGCTEDAQTDSLCYKNDRLLVALEFGIEVFAVLLDGAGGIFGKSF